MSCRSDPSPPSSGSNPTTSPTATTPQCPPTACPAMEIEINDTPTTDDDLVELKCDRPAHRSTVNCRIRATAACPTSSTVVLTNPDGRLRFPNAADTTKTLTVPGDGSWVPFQISGETGSAAIGDAVIEAHCNTATGDLKASKGVTVFWFDQAQINITAPGTYTVTGGRFTPTGGNAVDYSAQARIRPTGVNCAAPQVTNLRIGIMQNGLGPATRTLRYGTPSIRWTGGASGDTVIVPTTIELIWTQAGDANDSAPTVDPLYDQPGKADTLDGNSLKPPMGCAGGAAATSHDSPSGGAAAILSQPARTAAGAVVGSIDYHFINRTENSDFITWVVLFNTVTKGVCALRERTWVLRIDSAGAGPQRATPAAADRAPTRTPIIGGASANDLQRQSGPNAVGAATTTFRKP